MAPYYETAKVSVCACVFLLMYKNISPITTSPLTHRLFVRQSFADVEVTDDGVRTASFLHASDDFVNMFGELRFPVSPESLSLEIYVSIELPTPHIRFVDTHSRIYPYRLVHV